MKQFTLFIAAILGCLTATAQQRSTPMHFDRYLFVNVVVGDTLRTEFVFDTGAGTTLIDSTLAHSYGIRGQNIIQANMIGLGGTPVSALYVLDPIKIALGQYNYHSAGTVFASMDDVVEGCNGVIGITAVADTIFGIDYIKHRFNIYDRQELQALTGFSAIPFRVSDGGFIIVEVEVIADERTNDRIKAEMIFDTGSPNTLTFTPSSEQVGALINRFADRAVYEYGKIGVGGKSTVSMAKADGICFAGHLLGSSIIQISDNNTDVHSRENGAGIIGNDIFRRFEIIVDMPERVMYVRPNLDFLMSKPTYFPDFVIGKVADHCFVNAVTDRSPELQVGDLIERLNYLPLCAFSSDRIDAIFNTQGVAYTLLITRDEQQKMVAYKNS